MEAVGGGSTLIFFNELASGILDIPVSNSGIHILQDNRASINSINSARISALYKYFTERILKFSLLNLLISLYVLF